MPNPKTHVMSLRLSDDGNALLSALAEAQGTSKAAQIELAIRDRAKAHGIRLSVRSDRTEADGKA